MDSLLYPCILLASLSQIQLTLADCSIASISSPSASTLDVIWTSYAGATSYTLDLRLLDVTNVAPVSATVAAPSTEKLIQGLRSGSTYQVTLKVFSSSSVLCSTSKTATTVPASSQITTAKAVSSSSIQFEWSIATGADQYILLLEGPSYNVSNSFTSLKAQINNLQPSTSYKCSVFTSNVAGLGSRSKVKTMLTLIPPPGGVTVTATGSSSARVSWNSVAGVLQYQVNVTDNSAPAIAPVVVKTSSTVYDIRNLLPCSSFTMGVSSVNAYLDPGEPSNVNFKTSAIESPSSISVNYYCTSSMAVVNWLQVFGADSYRATVVDASGAQLSCTSASTSCQITSLPCGKFYFVTVTAVSSNCESNSQLATSFETVPCPPIGLTTYRECASNVIIFSWQGTNNTNYYVATSQGSDGQVAECYTTDTSCYFSNTACGITYQFSVYAVSGLCNSGRSASVNVSTAPCLPQNVKAFTDCSSYSLVTSWDLAPGALYYTVYAQGSRDSLYSCNSTSSSCSIDKVGCGESLSVWVSVSNGDCSDSLLEAVAETVPCTPENLLLVDECNADAVTLTWDPSNGGVFYIAMAVHSSGAMFTCQSTDPSCRIQGLHCGETYDTYVIATNLKCNSSKSKHVIYKTAPCPPSSVEAVRDCDFNQAWIKWQALQTGNYTAVITSKNGETLNCSTISNSCSIPNLRCGQNYSVTVQCKDNRCTSVPSTAVQIQSVPCVPTNISVARRCGDGSADVTWAPSAGGKNYTALAVSNRNSVGCTSNGVLCTITNLFCGQMYNVSVVATDNNCTSQCSQTVSLKTAPCTPLGVGGMVNCSSNTAVLSWLTSPNAVQYFGMAVGSDGHQLSCNVTSTSCPLSGLHCGQNYSFSVSASDGSCVSPASTGYRLVAAPCVPYNVTGRVDCISNSAWVSWQQVLGTDSYTVMAVGVDGMNSSCSTSNTTCNVPNLGCGNSYTFQVTASNKQCQSPASDVLQMETVPCSISSIMASYGCNSSSIQVVWGPTTGRRLYVATAQGNDFSTLSCNSTNSSCNLTNVKCGTQYSIIVAPSSNVCSTLRSQTYTISTTPCVPVNISTQKLCDTNGALVSWNPSAVASSYVLTATAGDGDLRTCSSSSASCSLTYLHCSQTYSLSVTASSGNCSSLPSTAITFKSVPCQPTGLVSQVQCGNGSALLAWTASAGAVAYTANALTDSGVVRCQSSQQSCALQGLRCGVLYNFTVQATDGQCYSSASAPVQNGAAPCAPSGLRVQTKTMQNERQVIKASWNSVDCPGSDYLLEARGSILGSPQALFEMFSYWAAVLSFEMPFPCSSTYNVSVRARNLAGVGMPSNITTGTTAPCLPQHVVYTGSNTSAAVSWSASVYADTYRVYDVSGAARRQICTTTLLSCAVANVNLKDIMVTASNAAGESGPAYVGA
uniref:Fibronectin type-III domain-containing protein n=2 Tax=Denticeps clupeoides TaxID=299321 RepID=A0AAY4AUD5_9TELE